MKKILILISFLFISVKPYQQVTNDKVNVDVIMLDTINLDRISDTISMQLEKSVELDKKKIKLQNELKRLKKKKFNKEKEELDDLKKALDEFNNRGI